MDEEKSVWVVERGQYSGYEVVGVFTTEANAQLVADKVDGTVACWPLDPAADQLSQGRSLWDVVMARNGDVESAQANDYQGLLDEEFKCWTRPDAPGYEGMAREVLVARVWATDEKHAVKIVNEHRTRLIAESKWGG